MCWKQPITSESLAVSQWVKSSLIILSGPQRARTASKHIAGVTQRGKHCQNADTYAAFDSHDLLFLNWPSAMDAGIAVQKATIAGNGTTWVNLCFPTCFPFAHGCFELFQFAGAWRVQAGCACQEHGLQRVNGQTEHKGHATYLLCLWWTFVAHTGCYRVPLSLLKCACSDSVRARACAQPTTCACGWTHTHSHSLTHTLTHTQTRARAEASTHSHTWTYTHAQTYTSTHDAIYEQNIDTKTIQNCTFVEHDHN